MPISDVLEAVTTAGTLADLTVSIVWVFQITDLTVSILSYDYGQIAITDLTVSIFGIIQIADLVLSIFCLFGVRSPISPNYHKYHPFLFYFSHRGNALLDSECASTTVTVHLFTTRLQKILMDPQKNELLVHLDGPIATVFNAG